EELAHGPEPGVWAVEPLHHGLAGGSPVQIQCLVKQGLLVAEGVVETLPAEAKMALQVGQRGGLITTGAEQLHGAGQDSLFIEGLGARHGDKVGIVDRSVKYSGSRESAPPWSSAKRLARRQLRVPQGRAARSVLSGPRQRLSRPGPVVQVSGWSH